MNSFTRVGLYFLYICNIRHAEVTFLVMIGKSNSKTVLYAPNEKEIFICQVIQFLHCFQRVPYRICSIYYDFWEKSFIKWFGLKVRYLITRALTSDKLFIWIRSKEHKSIPSYVLNNRQTSLQLSTRHHVSYPWSRPYLVPYVLIMIYSPEYFDLNKTG